MRNNVGIGAHLLERSKREKKRARKREKNYHFFPRCDAFSLYKNQYAYIAVADIHTCTETQLSGEQE
jgi:hypothetical protein